MPILRGLTFTGKTPGSVIAVERVGGHNRLVPQGLNDHVGTALQAVPRVRVWFDQLSASPGT